MSVPFSNTHLRVPRGFGTILEGLAREILRDQPEDIPKYAAQYFEALLQQRDGNADFLCAPEKWTFPFEWDKCCYLPSTCSCFLFLRGRKWHGPCWVGCETWRQILQQPCIQDYWGTISVLYKHTTLSIPMEPTLRPSAIFLSTLLVVFTANRLVPEESLRQRSPFPGERDFMRRREEEERDRMSTRERRGTSGHAIMLSCVHY